jgi:5'-3' exoribonuclease 1
MSGLALSKLTSSVMVNLGDSKTNIGLNLKFEAKSLKVLGYSRKGDAGWEFSNKALELIKEYNMKFPEVVDALERVKSSFSNLLTAEREKKLTSF